MAKTIGFIQRKRKLDAYDFFLSLTFGALKGTTLTLSSLAETLAKNISRTGIHLRFNEQTTEFIQKIYHHVFKLTHSSKNNISVQILDKFNRVNIIDSSSWKIPKRLNDAFHGFNAAGCKLQLMLDYKSGLPSLFDLTEETYPDSNYAKNIDEQIQRDDLFIFDMGYGLTNTFKLLDQRGAFFISRFNYHAINVYIKKDNIFKKVDILQLICHLNQHNSVNEFECFIGNNDTKVNVRFFAIKVPQHVADNKRRKLRKSASKKGCFPTRKTMQLCDWNFSITNIPQEKGLNFRDILAFYPLRWTIELFFKQLKSILAVHKTEVKHNEHRLRCEILGKCIVAMFISYCYSLARSHAWQMFSTEISFEKTVKYFKRNISILLDLLFMSVCRAVNLVKQMIIKIIHTCQKFRQKSRKNSLDVLIERSIYKNLNLVYIKQSVLVKANSLT